MGIMRIGLMVVGLMLAGAGALSALQPPTLFSAPGPQRIALQAERSSPQDLEITGDVPGIPVGESRFIRYADLAALHQVIFTVKDDANFDGPVQLSGVPLEELTAAIGLSAATKQLIAALSTDGYEGHYTAEYRIAHHPFLVMKEGGKSPGQWPKGPDGEVYGPYAISHPSFRSSFAILGQPEEPQIPFAVNKLRFYNEAAALNALKPPTSAGPAAMQGYRIVVENCLRCHRAADIGGNKSPFAWPQLALIAQGNASAFGKYLVQPNRVNPEATMPANPSFDAATVAAVTAYFQSQEQKP
jgi:mono/diheme cytochrome c family protein